MALPENISPDSHVDGLVLSVAVFRSGRPGSVLFLRLLLEKCDTLFYSKLQKLCSRREYYKQRNEVSTFACHYSELLQCMAALLYFSDTAVWDVCLTSITADLSACETPLLSLLLAALIFIYLVFRLGLISMGSGGVILTVFCEWNSHCQFVGHMGNSPHCFFNEK